MILFFIKALHSVQKTKIELRRLKETWVWSNSNLKLAAIGVPENLITEILRTGRYKAFVPNKNKTENDCNQDTNDQSDDEDLEPGGSMIVEKAEDSTLRAVISELQKVIAELLTRWDLRQPKTKLQESMMLAFGKIHNSDNVAMMVQLLQEVIKSLPPNQSELFEAQSCYPGFLSWNNYWNETFNRENIGLNLDPLKNVHKYYEDWAMKGNERNLPFQKLWENLMVRSTSEAICETIGSIMVQHGAKNRNLQPKNFNTEMYLRFNLPPLHHSDGLVNEVLAFDSNKTYVRKGSRLSKIVSQDVNKSAAIGTFEKKSETKAYLPESFWNPSMSK